MAKSKSNSKTSSKKTVKKVAKASKSSGKTKLSVASKLKQAGGKPAAAVAKGKAVIPKTEGKTEKKSKSPKKETKAKSEELDLFDDGDVTESEELLEYQEELEIQEEVEESSDSTDEALVEAAPAATAENEEDIVLTDAEGNRYCRAKDCDQISIVEGYCRFHYLLFWKKIQIRKEILQDGKLEKYVEDLTSRYPDKFLEMLRKDLRTTKDFLAAIAELEIDESAGENEFEEDAQTFIDEVRGLSDTGATMEDDDGF